jgi:hypothetical protein
MFLQHKKNILLLILTISLIGIVSSSYGYEDVSIGNIVNGKCINITQTCSNCTSINITSITFPNSTKAVSGVVMDKSSSEFYYNFCKANVNGQYFINYNGDGGITKNWFLVTTNGKDAPSGIVIISFVIMFLIISGFLFYFMVYNLLFFVDYKFSGKEEKPLYTLRDFLINISGFLILLVFYYLERTYLGNEMMNHVLSLSVLICSWTNIFFSIIALVLSFTISTWKEIAGMGKFTKW